jgi:hypothetical protein
MNKSDRAKVEAVAKFILGSWHGLIEDAKGDQWLHHDAEQAYHDCLIAMQKYGLIKDYDVVHMKVTL